MADGVVTDRTLATAATDAPTDLSRTRTIDDLVDEAGHLRNVTRALGEDVAETRRRVGLVHLRAFQAQLNARAPQLAKRGAAALLTELAAEGFAWRDMARMIGVSVPAVRRWRQGEAPTGEHLLAIARLAAFIETLRVDHLVADVAAWLEMPLIDSVPLTGFDLGAEGRYEELLDLAAGHSAPEFVLDRWLPGWRSRYESEFEVFEAGDGELGLRATGREDG